jgi:hypothetical protein
MRRLEQNRRLVKTGSRVGLSTGLARAGRRIVRLSQFGDCWPFWWGGMRFCQPLSADGNAPMPADDTARLLGPARTDRLGLLVVRARSHDGTPRIFSRAIEL